MRKAVKKYPATLTEDETLDLVLSGRSIARLGDGEGKIAIGRSIKSQEHDSELQRRMLALLRESGDCLVGVPNILSNTPKREFWDKQRWMADLYWNRQYASSFITRPDSAPWIDRPDYWEKIESLWNGLDVTLVRGSGKSLIADDLTSAGTITEIICARQHAYGDYEALLERIGTPKRALLCCGPTATVLAVDLCAKGVHAVDAGHVGMWIHKLRRGEPLIKTEADKAV